MKWRALLLMLVYGAGIATGYFGAQPEIRKQVHTAMMKGGELVEAQAAKLIQQVVGKDGTKKEDSNPPPVSPPVLTSTAPSDSPAIFAEYLRSFVHVSNLDAKRDGVGTVVILSGKVVNSGNRTLTNVEITIYFMGKDDIVFETKLPVVSNSSLPPNTAKDFSWRLDNVPLDWAGRVRATVTSIQF